MQRVLEVDLLLRQDLSLRARRLLLKESPVDSQFICELLAALLRRGTFEEARCRRLLTRVLNKSGDAESQRRLLSTTRNFTLLFSTLPPLPQQQEQQEVVLDWAQLFQPPPPPPAQV